MSHAYPNTVSARLTNQQLSHVLRAADRSGLSPSAFVRKLITKLADGATGSGDADGAVAAVCKALGLPADADISVIQAAFTALLNTLQPDSEPPPADGANESADPVPPAPGTPTLSAATLAACRKYNMKPADYVATLARARGLNAASSAVPTKRKSVTELRADRELSAKLKAKGMTLEQFNEAKLRAVKSR